MFLMFSGQPRETVRLIAKSENRPYKYRTVQKLRPPDLAKRLQFARYVLRKVDESPDFLKTLCVTDEAGFTQRGPINKQNERYWAPENPFWR